MQSSALLGHFIFYYLQFFIPVYIPIRIVSDVYIPCILALSTDIAEETVLVAIDWSTVA